MLQFSAVPHGAPDSLEAGNVRYRGTAAADKILRRFDASRITRRIFK
jgi:hypothetical protein